MDAPNWHELQKCLWDEDAAREMLERMRWPGGVRCAHCGGSAPYRLTPKPGSKTRKGLWKCRLCRKQFTVTVNSVMADSHIPLTKWLQAIYLTCASKKGISAHQLHRMLKIQYRSAWFMAHRLRHAVSQSPLNRKLAGVVEVDETWVGPKKVMRGLEWEKKTPVVALIERGGRARAYPVKRVTAETVGRIIRENVQSDATLMTDSSTVYPAVGAKFYEHLTVNHLAGEYARGRVHVNGAEGFFSLLKRGIAGIYHHVSVDHLGRYAQEASFKYSTRKFTDGERAATMMRASANKRLTYKPTGQPMDSLVAKHPRKKEI